MDFRYAQKEEEPGLVTSLHVKGDGERGELSEAGLGCFSHYSVIASAINYWQFIPIKNVDWNGFWEKIHIRDNELDHVRDNELGIRQKFGWIVSLPSCSGPGGTGSPVLIIGGTTILK